MEYLGIPIISIPFLIVELAPAQMKKTLYPNCFKELHCLKNIRLSFTGWTVVIWQTIKSFNTTLGIVLTVGLCYSGQTH